MTWHATDRRTGTVEAIWLLGAVKQVLAQAEREAEGVFGGDGVWVLRAQRLHASVSCLLQQPRCLCSQPHGQFAHSRCASSLSTNVQAEP